MDQSISHVPVFVDSTRHAHELKMTRFIYFYVEHTEPQATTYVASGDALPLLLVDLEGVIVSGLGGQERLDTPEAISDLFDFIDEKTPYVISANYLWLPNELLETYTGRRLSRGDVLRVYAPLFLQACAHARTPREIRLDDVPSDVRAVYLSEEETRAFREWTDRTVDRVKRRYREYPEMNLRKRQKRKER